MKYIELTQGQYAIVDNKEYNNFKKYKWQVMKMGRNGTYLYASTAIRKNGKQKNIRMHRMLMNPKDTEIIDHINGNTLDNRKCNLRICTKSQNTQNQKKVRSDNKLGIKGVWKSKNGEKFISQINNNGENTYLGTFNVLGDADSSYRMAEDKFFKEYSRNACI